MKRQGYGKPDSPLVLPGFLENTMSQYLRSFIQPSAFKQDLFQLPLHLPWWQLPSNHPPDAVGIVLHYILVVRLSSGWVVAFPCCKAGALTVTKNCEKMCSHLGLPSSCSLQAICLAPPCALGWWLWTWHCLPSRPLWNGLILMT